MDIDARYMIRRYKKSPLKEKGLLDDYLEEIEGKAYLYMREKKGKTLAKYIRSNVFDRHGFVCNDFDPEAYLESLMGI